MKPKTNSNHDAYDPPKKVFDVSRPGKTLAETTSRSVIVGHKPQVQDPMMTHPDEQRTLLDAKRKVTVTPSAPVVPESEKQPATDINSVAETPITEPKSVTSEAPDLDLPSQADTSAPVTSEMSAPEGQKESTQPLDVPTLPVDGVEPEAPKAADKGIEVTSDIAPDVPAEESQAAPLAPAELKPVAKPVPAEDSVAAILSEGTQEAEISAAAAASQGPLPDISDAHIYPPVTMIVSHHDKKVRVGKILLWTLFMLLVAVVIADILLDGGFFVLSVPHTNFF